MKKFMDENFLLGSEIAVKLFNNYAKNLPIIDYHCHINPEHIAKDISFDNITQVWLGGDHYKWRLMRAAGVSEKYITGNAPEKEKFIEYAKVISQCIGNPVFHWTHLELQRYFGYHGLLSAKTADDVWELCNKKLRSPEMSVKNIIIKSNVETLCTTDDPVDTLEHHKKIAEDKSFSTKVLPTFRPDKAVNIENPAFIDYIKKLGETADTKISTYDDLKNALRNRIKFFSEAGCHISDHGLDFVDYVPVGEEKAGEIFISALNGKQLCEHDVRGYKTEITLFFAREYHNAGWAMQLHYGCKRNNNPLMLEKVGPDTGYDCIGSCSDAGLLADFLGALSKENKLPRTVLYSLNPNDNATIDTIAGCFQESGYINKIQHGSAWWFNDHIDGMIGQMRSLAAGGFLTGFVGMLTDSRSFLSYPRHEYFRRILCNLIGEWVENGEYPDDADALSKIVSNISYNNAKNYFAL